MNPPPPTPSWQQRAADALLTTEPQQRLRLTQAGMALLLMAGGALALAVFVFPGQASRPAQIGWTLLTLGGMGLFYALIRSGWSRRWPDASLTRPQMIFALLSTAAAYSLLGEGRGAVFPVVMVIIALGIFQLPPQQVRGVCLFGIALFGVTMALMAWQRPAVYRPGVELGQFVVLATMMPAMALVASRLRMLRTLLREQRSELAGALSRIQELATHDELTGLVNHRHMQELLHQESQRCVRSGQSFCVALFDIDDFKDYNAAHGRATADEVLRRCAQTLRAAQRGADVLSRWGGDTFAVLMTDTRAGLARVGAERMREQLAAADAGPPPITVSGGVAEHLAGETLAQTQERALAALRQAKAEGRNRIILA